MNETEKEYTLDLVELWEMIWASRFFIVALIFVASILAFVKVHYFTDDMYTASGILYVSNKTEKENKAQTNTTEKIQKSDIDTARSLSTTYIEVLKTRSFLTEVSARIGGKYSWKQLKGMLTIGALNDTELLNISIKTTSPADSYRVIDSIIELAPSKLVGVFRGGEVETVDDAAYPDNADSRGYLQTVATGAMIGLVLGVAIIVIRKLIDNKVRKSADVAKRYEVSILGEIM